MGASSNRRRRGRATRAKSGRRIAATVGCRPCTPTTAPRSPPPGRRPAPSSAPTSRTRGSGTRRRTRTTTWSRAASRCSRAASSASGSAPSPTCTTEPKRYSVPPPTPNCAPPSCRACRTASSSPTRAGALIDVNAAWPRLFGYTRAELLGSRPPYPFWPDPETHPEAAAAFDAMGDMISKALDNAEYEVLFKHKDGHLFPALVSISAIRDDAGELQLLVGTVKDMTRHAEAENRLRLVAALTASLASANEPEDVGQAALAQLLPMLHATARRGIRAGAGSGIAPPRRRAVGLGSLHARAMGPPPARSRRARHRRGPLRRDPRHRRPGNVRSSVSGPGRRDPPARYPHDGAGPADQGLERRRPHIPRLRSPAPAPRGRTRLPDNSRADRRTGTRSGAPVRVPALGRFDAAARDAVVAAGRARRLQRRRKVRAGGRRTVSRRRLVRGRVPRPRSGRDCSRRHRRARHQRGCGHGPAPERPQRTGAYDRLRGRSGRAARSLRARHRRREGDDAAVRHRGFRCRHALLHVGRSSARAHRRRATVARASSTGDAAGRSRSPIRNAVVRKRSPTSPPAARSSSTRTVSSNGGPSRSKTGSQRLARAAAARAHLPVEQLCDELLDALVGDDHSDDIALVALRMSSPTASSFSYRVPATPVQLAHGAARAPRVAGPPGAPERPPRRHAPRSRRSVLQRGRARVHEHRTRHRRDRRLCQRRATRLHRA